MDIRKIALYLAGKLPPYYIKSNPWRFSRLVKIKFPAYVESEQLDFIQKNSIQTEELYFIVLDDIYKDYNAWEWYEVFLELLKELNIPEQVWTNNETIQPINSWTWTYNWDKFTKKIKSTYGSRPTTIEKWILFQSLCYDILHTIWGFSNIHVSSPWADWGIDITADKKIELWDNTYVSIWFFGQAKYKTNWNISKNEITTLLSPINKDKTNKYQCVFYFTNRDYAPGATLELSDIDWWNTNRKCFWLNGDQMLDIINSNKALEEKYTY